VTLPPDVAPSGHEVAEAERISPYLVDETGRRGRWCRGAVLVIVVGALTLFTGSFLAVAARPARSTTPTLVSQRGVAEVAAALPVGAGSDAGASPAPCVTLSGVAFVDRDLNGARTEQEVGLTGVGIKVFGPGDVPIATGSTDAEGDYRVTLTSPTTVRVEFSVPPDKFMWAPVGFDAGPSVAIPLGPDCVASVGLNDRVAFTSTSRDRAMQAGGRIYRDANCDGVTQAEEEPIAGAEVTMSDPTGAAVTTTSDSRGWYSFTGLRPETGYRVQAKGDAVALAGLSASTISGPATPPSDPDTIALSQTDGSPVAELMLATRGASTSSVHFGFAPDGACEAAEKARAASTKSAKSKKK
jgi:hypothetical protein